MTNFSLFNEKSPRSMDEFEFLQDPKDKNNRLGIGSFATVKLAREKKTGKLVAMKIVDLENSKNKASDLHNLRIEIYVHKRIEHDNIIKYHGYFTEKSLVYIILDYAEKGNLYGYIHRKKNLSNDEIFRFFYQSCLSIEYLHQMDVMHRDIKPENILLDKNLDVKLCDLGWCAERIRDKRTTFCGTYEYMAPEIVYKKSYDYRVDIWSLGVLLYELIHREAPYKGRSLSEISNSLTKTTITFNPTIDPQARELILRILRVNPNDRPSIKEILSHPWVVANIKSSSANGYSSVRSNLLINKDNQSSKSMTREKSDKQIQSVTQIYNKPKKSANGQMTPIGHQDGLKKRFFDEQTPEGVRTHIKSSGSLCKSPLDMDIEEKKEYNRRRNILNKNLEVKRQGSLSSTLKGNALIPISSQVCNDSNMSILPTTGSAKRAVNGLNSTNMSETPYSVGISAVAGAFNPVNNVNVKEVNPGSLKSLSNIGSITSIDSNAPDGHPLTPNSSTIPGLHKIRTQTGFQALMNSRPLGTPTSSETLYHNGVTTSRAPSHQKALTIINESGLTRRLVTEHHQGALTTQNRLANNGSSFGGQKYVDIASANSENIKAINNHMKGVVTSVGFTGRRVFIKNRGEMKTDSKSKENNPIVQYQSLDNKKLKPPSVDSDIRMIYDSQGNFIMPFNKYINKTDTKPKFLVSPTEELGAVKLLKRLTKEKRGVNKENRFGFEGSLNGIEVNDRIQTPLEFHYRSNYN